MATGPEHYQAAERLINAATREGGSANDTTIARACIALAQVHATLAQAAAGGVRRNGYDVDSWLHVAGPDREALFERTQE